MKINPKYILEQKILFAAAEQYPPINVEEQLQQNGIDIRLASAQKVVGRAELYVDKNRIVKPSFIDMQIVDNCYLFQPGEQYSLTFMEDVEIPSGMCAYVIHRSSINRTVGTIFSAHYDTGFKSVGGCGATFRPLVPVCIEIGTRVAQIIFEKAEEATLYDGQYQGKNCNK